MDFFNVIGNWELGIGDWELGICYLLFVICYLSVNSEQSTVNILDIINCRKLLSDLEILLSKT